MLLLSVLAITWARADEGGFTLRKVFFDATVHENNVWEVTETLDVEFFEPRHGIYRHIPTVFDYAGNRYKNRITAIDVKDYNYTTEDNEDSEDWMENKIIKIGSPNYTVEGRHTYVITYKLQYFDDRVSDYDFLNHSVWGADWKTSVDRLEFRIKFDKPLPADLGTLLNVYSGPWGSTGNAAGVDVRFDKASNTIYGGVANLAPNSAITLSAKLPQGYWAVEHKNMFTLYVMLAILAASIVVFFYKILSVRRRNPIRVVEFYPPEGISSAEVGKIIDDSSDTIDLASLIPWFAHHGYIKITEVPDRMGRVGKHAKLKLDKLAPLLPDAPRYQKTFMDAIFGSKKTVMLDDLGDRHTKIELSKKQLDQVYSGDRKLTDITGGFGFWFLTLLAAAAVLWCSHSTDAFDTGLPLVGLMSGIGAAFIVGIIRLMSAPKRSIRSKTSVIVEAVICAGIIAGGIAIATMFFKQYRVCYPLYYMYAGFAVLGIISYFVDRTSVDTKYRTDMMGRLLGLRDFIKTAEQSRLKMLVDENPQYFYDILPYAIVFDLSDKWAEQFAALNIQNPTWYHTSDSTLLMSSGLMAHTITHNMSQSIRSAVTQASIDHSSSSSGGSGGGFSFSGGSSFSGGGGGGGGGGSW